MPTRSRGQRPDRGILVGVLPFCVIGHECLGRATRHQLARALSTSLARRRHVDVVAYARMRCYEDPHIDVRRIGAERGWPCMVSGQAIGIDGEGNFLLSVRVRCSMTGDVILNVVGLSGHVHAIGAFCDRQLPRLAARIAEACRRYWTAMAPMATGPARPSALVERAIPAVVALDPESFDAAERDLQLAVADDRRLAVGWAWLGRAKILRIGQGWHRPGARAIVADEAEDCLEHALALDPDNPVALACKGHLLSWHRGRHAAGHGYLLASIDADRTNTLAWTLSSGTLAYRGFAEAAVEHLARGREVAPPGARDAFHHSSFNGMVWYAAGNCSEAVRWARLSLRQNPRYTSTYKYLAAAFAGLGRIGEAREMSRKVRALEPSLAGQGDGWTPFQSDRIARRYRRDLAEAGMFDPLLDAEARSPVKG